MLPRRIGYPAFILVAGVLLLLQAAIPALADDDDPLPTPDPRFGVIEAYHEPELADEVGIGWERIIFYWSELEKEGPDDWNWFHAPLERIDREIQGGRELMVLVQDTPAWATDGLPGVGIPRGLYLPVDDPGNVWASFIRDLVSAYQGRVNRWIIWNEPDIALDDYGAQWEGTTEDYYRLLKVAYLAAHEVNPGVQIHLCGLTYWHNPNYLHELLTVASRDPTAAENGYYFDVVSVHIYFKPETTLHIIDSLRRTLAEFGLEDKPIWLNETNAPPYDDPAQLWDNPVFEITQEMQASFLMQEFALALSAGVERIGVYKWIDEPPRPPGFEPYGLIRTNREPRPAFHAFRVILKYYSGAEEVWRFEHPELQEVIMARGQRTTRVVWSRVPDSVVIKMPALADSGLLVDQTGAETAIRPRRGMYRLKLAGAPCEWEEECLIGGPPLLVVEEVAVDRSDPRHIQSQIVKQLSLTHRLILALGGVGLIAALGWIVMRLRRGAARAASSLRSR